MAEFTDCNYAITLIEPYATLMGLGLKRNETRSRSTRFRGWLAVHAAKGWPVDYRLKIADKRFAEPILDGLAARCRIPADSIHLEASLLENLGQVIAVVHVTGCHMIGTHNTIPELERTFGDYRPGRYWYATDEVRVLKKPFPARGQQLIPWLMPRTITEDMLLPP